jgi:peroxiredoxin (alkyl hydroperoxide reductase subunit C)
MSSSASQTISVRMDVPEFAMETYEPTTGSFGRITLSEVRKASLWTVLVFYPADFTFVCPTELADIAEHLDEIQALGVKVISVSADTKFAHLAWRNSEKLLQKVRFSMGADPAGSVSKLLGVYDDFSGLARRGTFIISPEGTLVSAEVNLFNMGRDAGSCSAGSRPSPTSPCIRTKRAPRSGSPASRRSSPRRRWLATCLKC